MRKSAVRKIPFALILGLSRGQTAGEQALLGGSTNDTQDSIQSPNFLRNLTAEDCFRISIAFGTPKSDVA